MSQKSAPPPPSMSQNPQEREREREKVAQFQLSIKRDTPVPFGVVHVQLEEPKKTNKDERAIAFPPSP